MAIIDKKGVIHGSVSNIVYRNWRDQNVVQIKPAEIRQTGPSIEASLEFGLCSSTARVIRQAFLPAYRGWDGGMVNRLTCAVRKSISACPKERGDRDIHDADLSFLQGFQFNNNSPLDRVLKERPRVEMDQENKILVTLPAIGLHDIKSPWVNEYLIRLIVVTFDFKKDVYSYSGFREIRINSKERFEGGTISFEEPLPAGRLVALSMSVHGYTNSGFERMDTINSAAWSPAELLGVWQLPPAESSELVIEATTAEDRANNIQMRSKNRQMLAEIANLREKAVKGRKAEVPPGTTIKYGGFQLPKGDIPMDSR